MPTPDPEPTPAQLVDMSDILSLTIELTSEAIAADEDQEISDAKWAKTILDLASYAELLGDSGDIKKVGSIEFFENKASAQTTKIVNLIRRRYGLEDLAVSEPAGTSFSCLEIVF